ncbi:hypothetical protein ABH924_005047 [Arthrobacter sp. GAS37]
MTGRLTPVAGGDSPPGYSCSLSGARALSAASGSLIQVLGLFGGVAGAVD